MKNLIFSACLIIVLPIFSFGQQKEQNNSTMKMIDQVYPVFITGKLNETVKFYEDYFGFTKLFESAFFVLLQSQGDQKFCVAFMSEEHPTTPPSPKAFSGHGSFLTIEVSDANAIFQEVKKRGLPIAYTLKDEPWGQRRFGVLDPNQLWVDVVEQIQPVEGYWDAYLKH